MKIVKYTDIMLSIDDHKKIWEHIFKKKRDKKLKMVFDNSNEIDAYCVEINYDLYVTNYSIIYLKLDNCFIRRSEIDSFSVSKSSNKPGNITLNMKDGNKIILPYYQDLENILLNKGV